MFKTIIAIMALVSILCFVNVGCKDKETGKQNQKSIGSATMTGNGTIVLTLRAEDDSGKTMGDAQIYYAPSNPEYQEVLRHLGGLTTGETKPVPPWPEK